MKAVLLPVKSLAHAKTRLAGILSPQERSRLARAMLRDVAASLRASGASFIFLVSSDPWALDLARAWQWEALAEASQTSESRSVDWASAELAVRGFTHALRLPADIPLLRPEDVRGLLNRELAAAGAVIVPSRDGAGTNALLRTPPDAFPSRFGPNSLQFHLEEAERRGVPAAVERNPRIALDLDEPADLSAFLEFGQDSETRRALEAMKVWERIPRLG